MALAESGDLWYRWSVLCWHSRRAVHAKGVFSGSKNGAGSHLTFRASLWKVLTRVIDSGLVGSKDFFSGRGTTRAEDAQGTPAQSHISPSILVYEDSTES